MLRKELGYGPAARLWLRPALKPYIAGQIAALRVTGPQFERSAKETAVEAVSTETSQRQAKA